MLLVVVKLIRGQGTPSEEGKGGRGLWEQFPGPTNMPLSIRDRAGPSVEGMSRARAVTGGFWGQIVEKNRGVEEMGEGKVGLFVSWWGKKKKKKEKHFLVAMYR